MPPTQKPDDKEAAREQAALDKAAEKLDEKAEDAQAKADAVAAEAQKAEEQAEDFGEPKAARCPHPDCRERMERYRGDTPWKVGTHYCPNHGRVRL
jgi:septal ring factor EnvC (AmiA/AmiB activator)